MGQKEVDRGVAAGTSACKGHLKALLLGRIIRKRNVGEAGLKVLGGIFVLGFRRCLHGVIDTQRVELDGSILLRDCGLGVLLLAMGNCPHHRDCQEQERPSCGHGHSLMAEFPIHYLRFQGIHYICL